MLARDSTMQSKSDIPRNFLALYFNTCHWYQQEKTGYQNQSRNFKMCKLSTKSVLLKHFRVAAVPWDTLVNAEDPNVVGQEP